MSARRTGGPEARPSPLAAAWEKVKRPTTTLAALSLAAVPVIGPRDDFHPSSPVSPSPSSHSLSGVYPRDGVNAVPDPGGSLGWSTKDDSAYLYSDVAVMGQLSSILGGPLEQQDHGYRRVLQDAPNVQEPLSENDQNRYELLRSSLYRMETRALQGLSAEQQSKYLSVQAAVGDSDRAMLSLQQLLFTGELQGSTDLREGKSLLDRLEQMASPDARFAEGIDGKTLLRELTIELATPNAISQGDRPSCGATAVLLWVAKNDKAEYARIIQELGSPEGVVTLKSGKVFEREPGTDRDDDSGRATTQRLLTTFVEFTNGPLDYKNETGALGFALHPLMARLVSAIYDKPMDSMAVDPTNSDDAMKLVDASLQKGAPVWVSLDWGAKRKSGHFVLLHVDQAKDGTQVFTFEPDPLRLELENPYGQIEDMSREEFQSRLKSVVYEPAAVGAELASLDTDKGGFTRDAKTYARWTWEAASGWVVEQTKEPILKATVEVLQHLDSLELDIPKGT